MAEGDLQSGCSNLTFNLAALGLPQLEGRARSGMGDKLSIPLFEERTLSDSSCEKLPPFFGLQGRNSSDDLLSDSLLFSDDSADDLLHFS